MSKGKHVGKGAPHGTIPEYLAELAAPGFTVTEPLRFRNIEGSRTEFLVISLSVPPRSASEAGNRERMSRSVRRHRR